jgi:predicted SprT family Zn-dependent metalloprotease
LAVLAVSLSGTDGAEKTVSGEKPHGSILGWIPGVSTPASLLQALQVRNRLAHGLGVWEFGFNRRKRALGLCRYDARAIELSVYLINRNEMEEVRDTILHELAHALVGPDHGHDTVWRAKAVEVGARPQRCGQADMPAGRWRAQCGGCGEAFSRHRKPRRLTGWYCRGCGPQRGGLMWKGSG